MVRTRPARGLKITLASGKRFKKNPAALTHDVREHRAELDVGGLKRLVDPLDVAGLLAGQLLAGTGEVAQRLLRRSLAQSWAE